MSSHTGFSFYHYTPSLAAAVIFSALFLISSILHTYQLFRTRTWYLISFTIGGFCEWIGYIGRCMSNREAPDYTLGPYIIQSLLLLIAPLLLAASIYMGLGHIILLAGGEDRSPIRKKFLTTTFVCGDIFAFLVQSGGAGILTKKSPGSQKTGSNIIIGGLFIQLLSFGLFMLVSVIFHRRITSRPTPRSTNSQIPWRRHLIILYATSSLILVRSIFRAIEYIQGYNGYLISHEVFLYIFDGILMFVCMVLVNIVHPSEVNALLKGGRATTRALVKTQRLQKVTRVENLSDHEDVIPMGLQ